MGDEGYKNINQCHKEQIKPRIEPPSQPPPIAKERQLGDVYRTVYYSSDGNGEEQVLTHEAAGFPRFVGNYLTDPNKHRTIRILGAGGITG